MRSARPIFQLLQEIIAGLEAGETTMSMFMNLSNAFHCVIHRVVIEKLEKLGF